KTGALKTTIPARFEHPVIGICMGMHNAKQVFVLSKPDTNRSHCQLHLYDLETQSVSKEVKTQLSYAPSAANFVAGPHGRECAFTRGSSSEFYWWAPDQRPGLFQARSGGYSAFPGRQSGRLLTETGLYEFNKRDHQNHSHKEKRLPSIDGTLSLHITERGICRSHLHIGIVRLDNLGVLPWTDGIKKISFNRPLTVSLQVLLTKTRVVDVLS
ncbi:MAG: hypothetical protein F6K23_39445, partial [Okeania sp. SIO2C9]|uniref:hypothetical protein n=1 Tax=Okeania sp. SIO2C9 TaxID=2607791 RepID=UPI0013C17AF7